MCVPRADDEKMICLLAYKSSIRKQSTLQFVIQRDFQIEMSQFIRTSHTQAVEWSLHRRFHELSASGAELMIQFSFCIYVRVLRGVYADIGNDFFEFLGSLWILLVYLSLN
jgi:hypothetical protein